MTKEQVKEILDRFLGWPPADQEKAARFVRQIEQRREDDLTKQEWTIIEGRGARRDLATDSEVEELFRRFGRA